MRIGKVIIIIFILISLFFNIYFFYENSSKDLDYSEIKTINIISVLNYLNTYMPDYYKLGKFTNVNIEKLYLDNKVKYLAITNIDFMDFVYLFIFDSNDGKNIDNMQAVQCTYPINKYFFDYDIINMTQGDFIAIYNAGNGGMGNLEILNINNPDKVLYSIPAIDAYYEENNLLTKKYELDKKYEYNILTSSIYNGGMLKATYLDINIDGNTDIIFKGTQEIYITDNNGKRKREKVYYCEFVYLYDKENDIFNYSDKFSIYKEICEK